MTNWLGWVAGIATKCNQNAHADDLSFVSGNLSCSSRHPQVVDAIGAPTTSKLVIGHPNSPKAIQVP
jgi:hypothetical protein